MFYLNQFLKINDKCSKMVSKYSLNIELTVYSSTRFVIKHRACTWNRYNILVNCGTESIEVIHCSTLGWLQTIWLACIKGCFVGTLVISIGQSRLDTEDYKWSALSETKKTQTYFANIWTKYYFKISIDNFQYYRTYIDHWVSKWVKLI